MSAPAEARPGLRHLAAIQDLDVGAAVAPGPLRDDPAYGETLAREFSMLTAENALKFGPLRPGPDRWDFGGADALVDFAAAQDLEVRGHTLVWHNQVPAWVHDRADRDLPGILCEHIETVSDRYRGRLHAWDVVNEGLADDGTLRDTLWRRALGDDYIAKALRWAHQADPDARLFYNDYGAEGLNPKSDAVYRLACDLLDAGAPLHGVGLQMHIPLVGHPEPEQIAANMARLADLDLEIHVTEMDVRLPLPATAASLEAQAEVYGRILQVCLDCPACTALVLWGFTDRHSWIPHFFKGFGAALVFDDEYRPKPAYRALAAGLEGPP
ncbi:MAG: endo-1,4-beta-xylanase [Gemmatimonadota bacterium]